MQLDATHTPPITDLQPNSDKSRVFMADSLSVTKEKRLRSGLPARLWNWICSAAHWIFGLFSLVVILSVLATIPVLQFLSLGYLLEASGRIVRTQDFWKGFIGISTAARVGSIGLGVFLTMLPVRLFSSLWYSSYLLNGSTRQTQFLRVVVIVGGVLGLIHIGWAVARGGRLRHFLWPAPLRFWRCVREGGMYDRTSRRLLEFFESLRLGYYFRLGIRGFVGALIWLAVPISLMAIATKVNDPGFGGLLAFVGGVALGCVLQYLPFLQIRLPVTGRFASQFDVGAVRRQFKRAPFAYWFSLLLTLALAIPLYLLKAELIPREAAWLPSLFFVTFMFPARLAVGWAVSRAERRETPRIWLSRWLAWSGLLPVTLTYALIVYFTQFTSWHGSWSLYEQHAFLLPVPFLGF